MNIDLGWLGKAVLKDVHEIMSDLGCRVYDDSFIITHSGFTKDGIRVHRVIRAGERGNLLHLPTVWNNAILIEI